MIEQQLEERLRLAVADEPPLGFDPDDLVDRAFRRQRNRRAITAVAATVVAVATAATVTFAKQEGPPVASYPPSACLTSSEDVPPVDRLMRQALAEHLPVPFTLGSPHESGSLTRDDLICSLVWEYGGPPGPTPNVPGPALTIWLIHDSGYYRDPYGGDPTLSGTGKRLPDGSELRTYRTAPAPPQGYDVPNDQVAVAHVRPNGMTVVIYAAELNGVGIAEMTAFVTDPRLTF